MVALFKYPRTQHIQGSRLGPGDEDLSQVPFEQIADRHLVIEEKVDGANCGISFDAQGEQQLQSRGHFLTGGARERQFNLFKQWASTYAAEFYLALEERYVLYGEWLYAKHTIFYDALPDYFLEFDVLDLAEDVFLSTPRRRELLSGLPFSSVPVLREGPIENPGTLKALVGPSAYKSPRWREQLLQAARMPPHRADIVENQTDPSDAMEGLYIKIEEAGRVADRFKYVRHGFLTAVLDSESHWQSRPVLANRLAR